MAERQGRHQEAVDLFKRGGHLARINDGLYSYYTLDRIRERLENPELLELSTDELVRREREGPVR